MEKNRSKGSGRSVQKVVVDNSESMYFFPTSEEEIVSITSKLKGKASSGVDEVPDLLVEACITCIKNLLGLYLMNL